MSKFESNSFLSATKHLVDFLTKAEKEENLLKEKAFQRLPFLIKEIERIAVAEEKRRIESKSRFNPFDVLTRHHLEELHSRFLFSLFDPAGSHDCQTVFLELFIQTLKEKDELADCFSTLNLDYKKVKVFREYHIRDLGRIDMFIDFPDCFIVLENKLYAKEQKEQLVRYISYCKLTNSTKKIVALYLTLDGKNSEEAKEEKYYPISYHSEIIQWLEKCLESTVTFPNLYFSILNYYKLLTEKILNLPSKSEIMNIRDFVLKEENKILVKYLPEIKKTIESINQKNREDFYYKVYQYFKGKGYDIQPVKGIIDQISIKSIVSTNNSGFTFFDESLRLQIDKDQFIYPCIEHHATNLWWGLFGVKIENNRKSTFDVSKTAYQKIENLMVLRINHLEETEDSWICWKFFDANNLGFEFSDPKIDYELVENGEQIVFQFVEEVEMFLNAWQEVIQAL